MNVREGMRRPRAVTGFAVLVLALVVAAPASAADKTKPTTPKNMHVTATTTTSVSLAWTASTDNSGVFTYTVREVNSGQTRTVAQTQTTYTWTGLNPGTTYRFLVYARDGSGNQSANSNTVTVTTPAAPALPAPANLRVTAATTSTLSVAWDAVSGAASYQVARDSGTYSATGTALTFTGLMPGSSFSLKVRALNSASVPGPWSAAILGATAADTTPPSVPAVSGVALSPGVVQLTWAPSTEDSWLAAGYNVYVNGAPAHTMLPTLTPQPTTAIHNLRAATTYDFTVKAYDSSGNFSAASEVLTLTTPAGTDTTPPNTPANLRMTNVAGISTVDLAWNWALDNVGVKAFEVYADGVLVEEVLYDVQYPGVNTWVTMRHLQPGSTHTFTVKARDEAGNVSPASNAVVVTLQPSTDTTPPTATTLTWASNWGGCAFVDFMWSGGVDDVDTGYQLSYEIFEDGYSIGTWRTEVHEAGFGRHSYTLKVVDRAGNTSPASNALVLDNGFTCW